MICTTTQYTNSKTGAPLSLPPCLCLRILGRWLWTRTISKSTVRVWPRTPSLCSPSFFDVAQRLAHRVQEDCNPGRLQLDWRTLEWCRAPGCMLQPRNFFPHPDSGLDRLIPWKTSCPEGKRWSQTGRRRNAELAEAFRNQADHGGRDPRPSPSAKCDLPKSWKHSTPSPVRQAAIPVICAEEVDWLR